MVSEKEETLIAAHLRLIQEWHSVVATVSENDLKEMVRKHVIDALSLANYVKESVKEKTLWVDIGSGGGFPVIPIKVALPELEVVCVERSFKKTGFLRKVAGNLGLKGIEIIQGEFTSDLCRRNCNVITARAVEEPKKVMKHVKPCIQNGATFLCQTGEAVCWDHHMFHVEHIVDRWTETHLRRGRLSIIQNQDSN